MFAVAQLATVVGLVLVSAAFAGTSRWLSGPGGLAASWRRTTALLAFGLLPAQLVWLGLLAGVRWGIVAPPEGAWVPYVLVGVPALALLALAVTLLRTPGSIRPGSRSRPDGAQLEADALRADRPEG